ERWCCNMATQEGVAMFLTFAAMALAMQTPPEGEAFVDVGFAKGVCTLKIDDAAADFDALTPRVAALGKAGLTIRLMFDRKVPQRCRDAVSTAMDAAGFKLNRNKA